jgi:TonB family protein
MTPVLRVAHVWGDRLLEVRHLTGDGTFGPLIRSKGRVRMNDEAISVAQGKATRLVLGETTLMIELVEPQPRPKADPGDDDWSFLKIAGCVFVAFAALVAMMTIDVQLGLANADVDPSKFSPNLRKVVAEAPPKRLEALQRAKEKQLELAKKQAADAKNRPVKKLEAKTAGLLGAMEGMAGGPLFGSGLGATVNDALDKLKGEGPIADAQGLGGSRGNRFGGPGPDLGLFPTLLGARRHGGGAVGGNLEHQHQGGGGPCCSETRVTDGISKDVIGRVIRLHFSQVKFCYERELQSKPELAGKVSVRFVIDANGAVSEAAVAESTLEDANVEACVLAAIRHWKFPAPSGGGTAVVTHPWYFKPAGAED